MSEKIHKTIELKLLFFNFGSLLAVVTFVDDEDGHCAPSALSGYSKCAWKEKKSLTRKTILPDPKEQMSLHRIVVSYVYKNNRRSD